MNFFSSIARFLRKFFSNKSKKEFQDRFLEKLNLKHFFVLLLFATLGYLGNYFRLPLFFGVDFLFGSIFILIATYFYGTAIGVLTSSIAGSFTYVLWNHPYAAVLLILESLWVGIGLRHQEKRGRSRDMVVLSLSYWLCLGGPLCFLFYDSFLKIGFNSVVLVVLKQIINGAFNALIASLCINYLPLNKWVHKWQGDRHAQTIQQMLFHLLLAFVFVPLFAIAFLTGAQSLQTINHEIDVQLLSSTSSLTTDLKFWHQRHSTALKELAVTASDEQNLERLQLATTTLGKAMPTISFIYTTDAEGNILAAFPNISDSHRDNLDKNITHRDIFQQIKSTLKTAFGDIHIDEITAYPHIDLAVPIIKNNVFNGLVIGALDIFHIQDFLSQKSKASNADAFLIDRNNKIISSTAPDFPTGRFFDLTQGGEIHTIGSDRFQWFPNTKGMPAMMRLRKSYYLQQVMVSDEIPWNLVVRLSPVSYIDTLEQLYTKILALLLAIILPATIAANFLSRRFASPIAKLMRLTTNLQQNLAVDQDFTWYASNLKEIDALGYNFQVMAIALREKLQEIEEVNQSLEIRIQERTAELQASKQSLELITNSMPGLVYQFRRDRDSNYSVTYISEGITDIYDLTIEQVYADTSSMINMTLPDDRAMLIESIEESARTLSKWSMTYRILLANGKLKWITGSSIPIAQADGSIIWHGVITDVTDLKQTTLALQKSEERWQLANQAANDGVWDWNIETGVVFRSERWRTILGMESSIDNEQSINWVDLIHPDDRDRLLQIQKDYLAKRTLEYKPEYRMRCQDGSYRWIATHGKALWNEQDNPIRMVGINKDITDRKVAIASLEKRESYLTKLVEIQSHLLAESVNDQEYSNILGILGKVSDFSSVKLFICDHDPVDKPDLKLHSAWFADNISRPEEDEQNRFKQMIVSLQWLSRLANGEIINESLSTISETERPILTSKNLHSILMIPIFVSDNFLGFLSFHDYLCDRLRDSVEVSLLRVSASSLAMHLERQQAKMAMLQAMESAQAANRAKSDFLSTMSHEIRTPMNAVIGMTSLLLDTELSADQQEFAEIVRLSGDNLLTIINDILDFSKIESGQFRLDLQPFILRHCIEESLDLLASTAISKGIELAYCIDPDIPESIVSDITRLRQVLVNLFSNAVKFTAQGAVTLRVSIQAVDPQQQKYQLLFAVKDTGIGIPRDRYNRLFKPFSQVDSSTTREYGGTGLGLAIANQLTVLMGGEMSVESEVGVGSTFSFTIAISADPNAPVRTEWDLSLVGKNLLILEDNDISRESLTIFAKTLKMEVLATNSSEQAIAWLQREKQFDLAIVDAGIPITMINKKESSDQANNCSIIELMRMQSSSLPMIVLSHSFICDLAIPEPITICLNKPIKRSQLYSSLINLCSTHSLVERQSKQKNASLFDEDFANKFPLKILLAEDNIVNQKLATRFLNRLGYRIDVVANGTEVLDSLHRQNYDVILMDVYMPEMDGLTATRRIVAEFTQQPWIIALTANAMQGDREICLEAGMQDYISKPIQIKELIQALEKAHSSLR